MTYEDFIQYVKNWLSGTTQLVYIKECLQDEVELPINEAGIQQFPAAFITPLPFTIDDPNRNTYACRIYIAGDVGLSPIINPAGTTMSKRFKTYSMLISIFQKFIQTIPDDFNGIQYPIVATPVMLWDSNNDGLYFDITYVAGVDCL